LYAKKVIEEYVHVLRSDDERAAERIRDWRHCVSQTRSAMRSSVWEEMISWRML